MSDLGLVAEVDAAATTRFAVRDWHRAAACVAGADAVASGCVRTSSGRDSDALVRLDSGMSWPNGSHTTQPYTVTPLAAADGAGGGLTLLGELDNLCRSAQRFSGVARRGGRAPRCEASRARWCTSRRCSRGRCPVVVTIDVAIGQDGSALMQLKA